VKYCQKMLCLQRTTSWDPEGKLCMKHLRENVKLEAIYEDMTPQMEKFYRTGEWLGRDE